MTHNYTPNMLVKFIYGETDLFETLEIENTLSHDKALKSEYEGLKSGFDRLPKVQFSPKESSMNNILFFSNISQIEVLT